jgi:hypothetical protein
MAESRPWWASDGAPGSHRDDDPVAAHRAARHRAAPHLRAATEEADEPDDVGGPDEASTPAGAGGGTEAHVDGQWCGVCPVCTTARYLAERHPELLGHLGEAARHLLAAARALVEPPGPGDQPRDADDAAADDDGVTPYGRACPQDRPAGVAPRRRAAPSDGRLHRIDLE